MLLKEYITHHLIGSPLEGVAYKLRDLTKIQQRIKHPELREIYLESSRFEMAIAKIIDENSMNCIDIGAHLGSVLSVIKKLSPKGKHIAIEPLPYKCRWLNQKFPDVKVLQTALGDTAGEVDFFLHPHRSGFSGLKLNNSVDTTTVEILKVNCARLDDIIPSDLPIGFMKIDVEGGELAVLRGSQSILSRYQPTIIFECTQSGLKTHNLSPSDIYNFFCNYSYSIFLIKDWLIDGEPLSYEQFVKAMQYPFQAFNFLAVSNKG